MNKAALNFPVQVFFLFLFFFDIIHLYLWGIYLGLEQLSHKAGTYLILLGTVRKEFQNDYTIFHS